MKLTEMNRLIEKARERKCKSPCITAILLANYDTLRYEQTIDICRELGLPDSYVHQVRTILQVPGELELLGFKIARR